MATFALQKDFGYLSSLIEQKANIEEVNESLQQKANKTSVANALQRKANRADVDTLLEAKADVTDLEKIIGILEGKLDLAKFEELSMGLKQSSAFVDRSEFQRLSSALLKKAEREDLDELYKSMQTYKADSDKRILAIEKDFDKHSGETKREMEQVKGNIVSSLSKKADFALLERLRESNNKKVDFDQFQSQLNKVKQEFETLIESNAMPQNKRPAEQHEEKLAKAVTNSERALDELYYFRETMKSMQEERKKDIEDTADFINQLLNNSKAE